MLNYPNRLSPRAQPREGGHTQGCCMGYLSAGLRHVGRQSIFFSFFFFFVRSTLGGAGGAGGVQCYRGVSPQIINFVNCSHSHQLIYRSYSCKPTTVTGVSR